MKKTLFLIASISFTCSMHGQMAPQESEWYTPTPRKLYRALNQEQLPPTQSSSSTGSWNHLHISL